MLYHESAEEREGFLRLKHQLGALGILFPSTPEQVRVFKQMEDKKQEAGRLYPDPMAIIEGDYRAGRFKEIAKAINPNDFKTDFVKAAARNGKVVPEEVLRKMRRDRE